MAFSWDPGNTDHDRLVRDTFGTICALLSVAAPKIGQGNRALLCRQRENRFEVRWEGKDWNVLELEFVPASKERQSYIHFESRQAGKAEIFKAVIQPVSDEHFSLQSGSHLKEVAFKNIVDALLLPALYEP